MSFNKFNEYYKIIQHLGSLTFFIFFISSILNLSIIDIPLLLFGTNTQLINLLSTSSIILILSYYLITL